MEEASLELTQFAHQAASGQLPGDEHLFVRFFKMPVHNKGKSLEAGRPIFDELDYVEIIVPGDTENIVRKPVGEKEARRFGRQYEDWKVGQETSEDGMPLEAWPAITRGQVEELKMLKIFTVEQLANLNDDYASRYAGIPTLKQRADVFLKAAEGMAPADQMVDELNDAKNTIETQKGQIEDLQISLAAMQQRLDSVSAPVEVTNEDE